MQVASLSLRDHSRADQGLHPPNTVCDAGVRWPACIDAAITAGCDQAATALDAGGRQCDLDPFVLSSAVIAKLAFIHRVVHSKHARQ